LDLFPAAFLAGALLVVDFLVVFLTAFDLLAFLAGALLAAVFLVAVLVKLENHLKK